MTSPGPDPLVCPLKILLWSMAAAVLRLDADLGMGQPVSWTTGHARLCRLKRSLNNLPRLDDSLTMTASVHPFGNGMDWTGSAAAAALARSLVRALTHSLFLPLPLCLVCLAPARSVVGGGGGRWWCV